ncbi:hypothetical protein T08_15260 [Trichinella sp. T8]|nr:hypothetical protein T08_15260 [Trichinella sp. T8]
MMHPRPAYPKSIHNVATFYHSIYYSLLAVYPPHTYLQQFREEYPPTTLPPPTQSCEPHRHFLHQSLCHSYSPTPSITHQFLYTCRPLIPQVIARFTPLQHQFRGLILGLYGTVIC